ncbi:hypothetical protein [Geodermatophilus sp. DF01-2]|uniref:hypothetical protein n=1 Tax=Geodermatophilus sp. DF01-2 TaxID=2559610 RepID=UPI00143087DC|nr:hypothetical protein [Geodermatophilus sp. DF01_2]
MPSGDRPSDLILTATELAALAESLAPAQAAQAAQRRFEQRGGPRRRAPGAGSTGLLSDADRVLVTVVYQRQVCSHRARRHPVRQRGRAPRLRRGSQTRQRRADKLILYRPTSCATSSLA